MPSPPFDSMLAAMLWMKRALLGTVTPSLRAVIVNMDFDQEIYICYFYYDGPITEKLFDLASCAAAEASDCWYCEEHFLQLGYPEPIPQNGLFAYLRKEPNFNPPSVEFLPRVSNCISVAYLSYALQQGLLGKVVPSLRSVSIDINEESKILMFYFYYDEEISEELMRLSEEAITIACQAFPSDYQSREVIEYLSYPQKIPDVGKRSVYSRYE